MSLAVRRLLVLAVLFALVGCDPGPRFSPRDGGTDGGDPGADTDGDGISDADEGAADRRDTDGDGTPDFEDSDSDNDGIPDSVEAGDADPASPPFDSDSDSTPDFIDDDSDDNGIPDGMEADGDIDGDGVENRADLDDDGDGIRDRIEIDISGVTGDADEDGAPDFQDPDSDNDTISDGQERDQDTDGDGIPDTRDLDSDDDGIPDAQEAGDADLDTIPFDSDGDLVPDFRDADSDNDGLADGDEVLIHMTDPTDPDSDGDGVSDLIEIGAGTNPSDPSDDPRRRGDFVFVVPFMEAPDPARDTLTFSTSIQFADVYFLFDTTTSMRGEISAMRSAVESVINSVSCDATTAACTGDEDCTGVTTPAGADTICRDGICIEDPRVGSCIASVFTGVGTYDGNNNSYDDLLSLQPDPALTASRIPGTANGGGADEALFESVSCVGAPSVCSAGATRSCGPGMIGTPCFRPDAVRILVAITDERDHCTDCASDSASLAGAALTGSGITFVGIDADSGNEPDAHLRAIARESGSYRADGTTELVFAGGEAAVTTAVTNAINEIVEGVPLRVTIEATDETGDDGDALQFIQALETNTTGTGCSAIATEDANPAGDGIQDTFPAVTPGTPVCWDVIPEMNTTVMPDTRPLVFEALLTVSGDGSPLDSRRVFFLVPPEIPPPGGPD
ncbi:MAG: hypothetical protein AB8I08_32210 [Sandaracinaceae bacterium]